MAGIKNPDVGGLLLVCLFFCAIMVIMATKRSHDETRDIILAAHECYNQELRAVLIDGEVSCRD